MSTNTKIGLIIICVSIAVTFFVERDIIRKLKI